VRYQIYSVKMRTSSQSGERRSPQNRGVCYTGSEACFTALSRIKRLKRCAPKKRNTIEYCGAIGHRRADEEYAARAASVLPTKLAYYHRADRVSMVWLPTEVKLHKPRTFWDFPLSKRHKRLSILSHSLDRERCLRLQDPMPAHTADDALEQRKSAL